jgi:hypothetical protein
MTDFTFPAQNLAAGSLYIQVPQQLTIRCPRNLALAPARDPAAAFPSLNCKVEAQVSSMEQGQWNLHLLGVCAIPPAGPKEKSRWFTEGSHFLDPDGCTQPLPQQDARPSCSMVQWLKQTYSKQRVEPNQRKGKECIKPQQFKFHIGISKEYWNRGISNTNSLFFNVLHLWTQFQWDKACCL